MAARQLRLHWRCEPGPAFEEVFEFPGAPRVVDSQRRLALDRACELLGQVAGVSYYKAFLPPQIQFSAAGISSARARFLQETYEFGLAEFAHQNGISLRDKIRFPVGQGEVEPPPSLNWGDTVAVPVGGGKDSVVSLELAKSSASPVVSMQVGSSPLIESVISASGVPRVQILRRLSPNLKQINAEGALNGHVPVTGILSAAFLVASIWHDLGTVIMSNERSADAPNLIDQHGTAVNHQYSKSLAFEQSFSRVVESEVVKGWRYFSLLRPLSELAIARLFARHEAYFAVFSSCNRNFHLDGSRTSDRWCRNCPKCRFVFLALANFVERDTLLSIFGGNLLDDQNQQAGFDALIGAADHKPFECVGEVAESRSALDALSARTEWRDDYLIKRYLTEQKPKLPAAPPLQSHLGLADDHRVSAPWLADLKSALS